MARRRPAKVTAGANAGDRIDRYAQLAKAGFIPHCISAQLEIEAGSDPGSEAVLRHSRCCRGKYAIRTQQLLPDPDAKPDPVTGVQPNKTVWVDAVRECKAPWHTGDESVYDSGPVIEAGRRARALRDGVALTRVEGGQLVKDQCKNGHDMTGTMPNGKPVRHKTDRGEVCRQCKADAAARHKARKQEAA